MAEIESSGDRFIRRFRQHLTEVDELSNTILRGHLEVERDLDEIVELIFFRPEYLKDIRLGFADRVSLARAYAPDPDDSVWNVARCLNEARNAIAHRRTPEARAGKIANLRKSISGIGKETLRKETAAADDKEAVVIACAICCGFLAFLHDSVWDVRDTISAKLQNVPKPPPKKEYD
jgi:hypothetical protein